MILWILACRPAAPDLAHPGVRAAMDHDGDGRVSAEEYRRGPGQPFPEVDKDGDGALSGGEIEAMVLATDPDSFDPRSALRPVNEGRSARGAHTGPLREALQFLAEEAVQRGAAPFGAAELEAAAQAGMESAAGGAILARLRAAGVSIPPGLDAAEADPPVGEPGALPQVSSQGASQGTSEGAPPGPVGPPLPTSAATPPGPP